MRRGRGAFPGPPRCAGRGRGGPVVPPRV